VRSPVLARAILFVLSVACASAASAQGLEGGIKAGVNFAKVSGPPSSGTSKSARVGGVVGGYLTAVLSDLIGVQPEVMYSMEGVKTTASVGAVAVESKAKIDMLRVALLMRLGSRPAAGGGYVLLGPSLGVVTRARESFTGEAENDFKSELRKSELAVVIGAGYVFGHLLGEARYTAGLTDLNNISIGRAQRSEVLSVLGGVRF